MTDLRERFRSLDGLGAPDLRSQIELPPSNRSALDRVAARRVAAGVVALVLSAAGTLVALRAFVTAPTEDARRSAPSGPERLSPRIVAEIPLTDFGTTIAAGEGQVWVGIQTSQQEGLVARVDTGSNRLGEPVRIDAIPLPAGVSRGAVWVHGYVEKGPNLLLRIDAVTNAITDSLELPEYSSGVEATPSAVWVVVNRDPPNGSDEVWLLRFDPVTAQLVERIAVPGAEYVASMAVAGGAVWLASFDAGEECARLYRVDEVTHDVRSFSGGPPDAREGSGGLRIVGGGDSLWINCRIAAEELLVRRIDARTGMIGPTFETPERFEAPIGVSADGVWLRAYDEHDRVDLLLLDPRTGESSVVVQNKGNDFGGVVDLENDAVWLLETEAVFRIDLHE